MENGSPETLKDATPKTPITQAEVDTVRDDAKNSRDIATENTRKDVYEKFAELQADKTIISSKNGTKKIIESVEGNKITPEEALKQLYKLEVILRTPFVAPAF